MEQIPFYIQAIFILTTLLAAAMFVKAAHGSKFVMAILAVWLLLQAVVGLSGFYTITITKPPRFALLLIPPALMILIRFLTRGGRKFMDTLDLSVLTLLHIVRIPVEISLFLLYQHKMIPKIMTFEGNNFDILCGITAPFIYYFGYVKKSLGRNALLAWNIICLLIVINIVVTAVLSAPFSFQRFGFEQPNIALFYFPFVWLPCCVVPLVLFSHLVTIRSLLKK